MEIPSILSVKFCVWFQAIRYKITHLNWQNYWDMQNIHIFRTFCITTIKNFLWGEFHETKCKTFYFSYTFWTQSLNPFNANDQQIYIETSQLICQAYHLIGLSMKGKLILNGLMRIIAQRASAKSCMDILANSCILVKIFLMFEKINKLIHSERQSSKQDNILIK